MGKIIKKGTVGPGTNFVSRSQAIKKLQISLADFRRLCILKGIYPRVPSKKLSGPNTTYYLKKDITFLAHEPVLNSFREIKVHKRKVAKRAHRGERSRAKMLKVMAPTYALDHIVRERYPTFVDALRELGDCLSLICLFAHLPAEKGVDPRVISNCKRLLDEWHAYLAETRAVSKSFASIKGMYYQANVEGVPIVWVEPHQYLAEPNADVDFRVMRTFIEFYSTMLGFVLFRLYGSISRPYPPVLVDYTTKVWTPVEREEVEEESEESEGSGEDGEVVEREEKTKTPTWTLSQKIFKGMVVAFSREIPHHPLWLTCTSAGATVIPFACLKDSDLTPTHFVVDRPPHHMDKVVGARIPGCEYLQPQWFFDSLNHVVRLPTSEYLTSVDALPPHLSPFAQQIDMRFQDGHIPERANEIEMYVKQAKARELGVDLAELEQRERDERGEEQGAEDEESQGEAVSDEEEDVVVEEGADAGDVVEANVTLEEDELEVRKAMLSKKQARVYSRMKRHDQVREERRERLTEKVAAKGAAKPEKKAKKGKKGKKSQ
ncbi:pescadillo [Kipferlia bialata]|uniref:Pescadillo homolog n=1 Tax=Kipferlia bialata TaxID=797122 RepID=A0A9K3CSD4_9EUKA|nr:pescadillo [Kipferlia bialata]|eukprot:g2838.t1